MRVHFKWIATTNLFIARVGHSRFAATAKVGVVTRLQCRRLTRRSHPPSLPAARPPPDRWRLPGRRPTFVQQPHLSNRHLHLQHLQRIQQNAAARRSAYPLLELVSASGTSSVSGAPATVSFSPMHLPDTTDSSLMRAATSDLHMYCDLLPSYSQLNAIVKEQAAAVASRLVASAGGELSGGCGLARRRGLTQRPRRLEGMTLTVWAHSRSSSEVDAILARVLTSLSEAGWLPLQESIEPSGSDDSGTQPDEEGDSTSHSKAAPIRIGLILGAGIGVVVVICLAVAAMVWRHGGLGCARSPRRNMQAATPEVIKVQPRGLVRKFSSNSDGFPEVSF